MSLTVGGFPSCCGASILSSIYKNYGEDNDSFVRRIMEKVSLNNFTLAITAPEQGLDAIMEQASFKRLCKFQTRYEYEKGTRWGRLTLWACWKGGDTAELYAGQKTIQARMVKKIPKAFQFPPYARLASGGKVHRMREPARSACGVYRDTPKAFKAAAGDTWYEDRCFTCDYNGAFLD